MFGIFSKKKKDIPENLPQNTINSDLVVLIILDGLGISLEKEGNAVYQAKTPFLDTIWTKARKTLIYSSGTHVGSPDGEPGNSEVGHLNIGAGRVVYQTLPLVNDAIMGGEFQKHPVLLNAFQKAKESSGKLHLMGILSAGGVHGHISHLFELLEMCKENGVEPYVHAFLDGRDTDPTDGYFYLSKLMSKFRDLGVGKLASICGRFYAMDRDNRWQRVELAYDAMTGFGQRTAKDPFAIIQHAYQNEENDEIFLPTTMVDENDDPVGAISDGDVCIMYNFREDRAREIIKVFVGEEFEFFERRHEPKNINFVSMMGYGEGLHMDVVFPPKDIKNTLSSVIADRGMKQLHISETEKYAHVTYFLNGGREKPHKGEQFFNVPSRKVFDYAETPEMSAEIVTDEVLYRLDRLEENKLSFIIINFANPDMLGHTGNLQETIQAVEYIDMCTKKIVQKTVSVNGVAMVTADHGNAEYMFDKVSGKTDNKHTTGPVPFIFVSEMNECKILEGEQIYPIGFGAENAPTGMLGDIAPTVLAVLNIDLPVDMTGFNLLDVM